MVDLSKMKLNIPGIITSLEVDENIKRRFLDLGIVPDVKIVRVLEDYSGNMSAYLVMDSLIAIRNKDVKGVKIVYE